MKEKNTHEIDSRVLDMRANKTRCESSCRDFFITSKIGYFNIIIFLVSLTLFYLHMDDTFLALMIIFLKQKL